MQSHRRDLLIAALLGALAGGAGVAIATRAVPTMFKRLMSGMMQNMMANMQACGASPRDM